MEGERGKTCLAYEVKSPGTVVAIKQCRVTQSSQTKDLARPSHANIVKLLCVFVAQEAVYFAYERMDITLTHLYNCVSLDEPHISFICKEVRMILVLHY
jgi:serine/threonine protein kinase